MRRVFLFLAFVACSRESAPPPANLDGPVAFRALAERVNSSPCREAPDFEIALTEEEWIDIFDLETECVSGRDIELPEVRFDDEAGVAVSWKQVPCLGYTIRTRAIQRVGDEIVVTAETKAPAGSCAQAIGQLESFLALERSDRFTGNEGLRFDLDGTTIGTLPKR